MCDFRFIISLWIYDGSVGLAPGCLVGGLVGREFDSCQTNIHGLKITKGKVLLLELH